MDPFNIALLVGAGLAAGFVAGLTGVGGGIIFAPVLFFYFQRIGVEPEVVTPLTLGTSLFCTLLAGLSSAWFQDRAGLVERRVAGVTGVFSAVPILLMTLFVTTRPWYDGRVFQIVFSLILLAVVARMVLGGPAEHDRDEAEPVPPRTGWPRYAVTGAAAGCISAASGVGGGVVLLPMYNRLLRLPMRLAVGTSSATVALISLAGVLAYMLLGRGAPVPPSAAGYVDFGHALPLVLPAVFSSRYGVRTAHRIHTRMLQWSFAALAVFVAIRLLLRAVGG